MHPTLVKICGLTSPEDAVAASEAGADWIGLNFHPPSPRFLDGTRARAILASLATTVEPVGLFVNRRPAEVRAVAEALGLRVVQLHGDEPPEAVAGLAGLRVVRAFRVAEEADLAEVAAFAETARDLGHPLEAVLLDARVDGKFGGTGRTIPEALLDRLPSWADRLPRVILAGGLSPINVADRAARARPWMVDVASGVEVEPGRKAAALVRAFVRAARGFVDPR